MKKIIFWAFVALMMVGCCNSNDKRSLRILSYNVGVFNKYLQDGYADVANIIKETNADIVLFQELDSCTTRTGKVYQLERICSMRRALIYSLSPQPPYLVNIRLR